jgi:hypothetical protein
VQRQRAIWHVLRDARRDVALWQAASRRADVLADGPRVDDRTRLSRVRLERVIGTTGAATLQVRRQSRAFRETFVLAQSSHDALDKALTVATETWSELAAADPPRTEQLYWNRLPMVREGQVRWAIMAAGGEAGWKAGLRLQEALARRSGRRAPLTRALPGDLEDLDLVWVLAGPATAGTLPAPVQEALEASPEDQLVTARVPDGPILAVLRDAALLDALLEGVHPAPLPFAPARNVK